MSSPNTKSDFQWCELCASWQELGKPHRWRWSRVICTDEQPRDLTALKPRALWPNTGLDKAPD